MFLPKRPEEIVIELRTLFAQLERNLQVREVARMKRILEGKKPIMVEPVDDPTVVYKFSNPYEVIRWLNGLGIKSKSNSNIYKCLRGERPQVYGYKMYYGQE